MLLVRLWACVGGPDRGNWVQDPLNERRRKMRIRAQGWFGFCEMIGFWLPLLPLVCLSSTAGCGLAGQAGLFSGSDG